MIFSNVKDITLPEGNVIQIAVNKQAHWNKRITDETVAYTKDVPENALPFAELQKLGGMTYRVNLGTDDAPNYVLRSAPVTSVESVGANLIPFPYVNNTATLKGVTFTVNNDGSITCKGTATEAVNFWLFGDDTLEKIGVKDGETLCISGSGTSTILGVYDVTAKTGYNNGQSFIVDITHKYRVRINVSANQSVDTTVYPMLNKGSAALPYAPYTKSTLPIPEAVQALDGYGEGINESVYNYITWNPEGNVKTYTKAVEITDLGAKTWYFSSDGNSYAYALGQGKYKYKSPMVANLPSRFTSITCDNVGNIVVRFTAGAFTTAEEVKAAMSGVYAAIALATPEVTDISDLITADNLIPVQGNGTITFVNEYGYAVPSSVKYTLGVTDNADG